MSSIKAPKDTSPYEKHYSEFKFWNKAKSLGKNVLRPAMLLFYLMKSSEVSLETKAKIAGALGYLILPFDFIPDFIPVAGYADDVAALLAVIKMCKNNITPEIKVQAEEKLKDLLG